MTDATDPKATGPGPDEAALARFTRRLLTHAADYLASAGFKPGYAVLIELRKTSRASEVLVVLTLNGQPAGSFFERVPKGIV